MLDCRDGLCLLFNRFRVEANVVCRNATGRTFANHCSPAVVPEIVLQFGANIIGFIRETFLSVPYFKRK